MVAFASGIDGGGGMPVAQGEQPVEHANARNTPRPEHGTGPCTGSVADRPGFFSIHSLPSSGLDIFSGGMCSRQVLRPIRQPCAGLPGRGTPIRSGARRH